jgi:hypothetical protein
MGVLHDLIHAGGTGGLNWHIHAHYSSARWQPTSQLIEQFLSSVKLNNTHLLLIGGSAGWMLPHSWLVRFKHIDTFDIDPLVPWLFNWRHGRQLERLGIKIQHHRQDAISTLADLVAQYPNACIWFDNVLGQHRYRVRDEARVEDELSNLKITLQGRNWGSVHDVWSGPTDGRRLPAGLNVWQHQTRAKQNLNIDFSQKLLASVGAKDTWQDHLTGHVFEADTNITWIPWAFKSNYWHWLQVGWVSS